MKGKNYLKEELSKEEKVYLKKTVRTARYNFIEKLNRDGNEYTVELNEKIIFDKESIVTDVLENCIKELESAINFEETLSNPLLYKYVKQLSAREKKIIFYLFWQNKPINEVAEIMKINRKTVRENRDKALARIGEKLIKGGFKYV